MNVNVNQNTFYSSRDRLSQNKCKLILSKEKKASKIKLNEEREFYEISGTVFPLLAKYGEESLSKFWEKGGNPVVTDRLDLEDIAHLLKSNRFHSQEKAKLQQYYNDITRSFSLNHMIEAQFYKKECKSPKFRETLAEQVKEHLRGLKEGESIYLNWGHFNHSMSIRFFKQNGSMKLILHDSSGGVYRYFLLRSFFKIPTILPNLRKDGSINTAVEIEVKDRNLFGEKGKEYFKKLFVNYTEVKAFNKRQEIVDRIAEHVPHFLRGLVYVLRLIAKWKPSVNCFLSIPSSSPRLLSLPQFPQRGSNCHIARVDTMKLQAFGKELYKKVKNATYEKRRKDFITRAIAKKLLGRHQVNSLKNLPMTYLTHQERRAATDRLASAESNEFDYKEWKAAIQLLNHKIAMDRLIKVDKQNLNDVRSFKASRHKLSPEALKASIVINNYDFANIKKRKIGVSYKGKWTELNKSDFLKELKKHPEVLVSEEVVLILQFFSLNYGELSKQVKAELAEVRHLQGGLIAREQQKQFEKVESKIASRLGDDQCPAEEQKKLSGYLKKIKSMRKSMVKLLERKRYEQAVQTYFRQQQVLEGIEQKLLPSS